jgi:hypothetical protein
MQYAERLPNPKSLVVPVVALAIGAAAATGGYALIDSDQVNLPEPKVIVSETPAPSSEGLAAKDEAATAAAIGRTAPNSFGKDEAATAAAISPLASRIPQNSSGKDEAGTAAPVGIPSPAAAAKMNGGAGSGTATKDEAGTAAAISQSNGIVLRGSKASASGTGSSDTTIQSDPQGGKPGFGGP